VKPALYWVRTRRGADGFLRCVLFHSDEIRSERSDDEFESALGSSGCVGGFTPFVARGGSRTEVFLGADSCAACLRGEFSRCSSSSLVVWNGGAL